MKNRPHSSSQGFTLIELSIVLVIIGLIVGGVLVGRDLITAAEVRAQITQIEKYNSAVNTFRGKYNELPGDMSTAAANNFGFVSGAGDGNGLLQGDARNYVQEGEPALFWVHLSQAKLLDGNFSTANASWVFTDINSTALDRWLPKAKLGSANYVYVWSGGYLNQASGSYADGKNYYTIAASTQIRGSSMGEIISTTGVTVRAAYNIDQKIDDGLPQSGSVLAIYPYNDGSSDTVMWAAAGNLIGAYDYDGNSSRVPTTSATAYAATNCYDNNNVAGVQKYSLTNNANMTNCNISIKMQ